MPLVVSVSPALQAARQVLLRMAGVAALRVSRAAMAVHPVPLRAALAGR